MKHHSSSRVKEEEKVSTLPKTRCLEHTATQSKMRKSLLVLLFVSTLLVMDTEASWFRRTVKKVTSTVKKVVNTTKKAVSNVASWVKKHEPVISVAVNAVKLGTVLLGKRSADVPPCPQEDEKKQAVQLLEELQRDCPTFGIDASAGLTREAVIDTFENSDMNEDGILNDEELVFFESVIEVYGQCVDLELAKRK